MKRVQQVFRHMQILMWPVLTSGCVSTLWYYIFLPFGLRVPESDESVITNMAVAAVLIYHAILSTKTLDKAWAKYDRWCQAMDAGEKDEKRMLSRLKRGRIPVDIHVLLGTIAVTAQVLVLMVPYDAAITGILVNAAISLMLAMYWVVATNLDNPEKAVWIKHRHSPGQ